MIATISVDHDPRLLELFAPEEKDIPRARYAVSDTGDAILFHVTADDAVALRAILGSITKQLSLWERTEGIR